MELLVKSNKKTWKFYSSFYFFLELTYTCSVDIVEEPHFVGYSAIHYYYCAAQNLSPHLHSRFYHSQNLEEQHMANKVPCQNKLLDNFTCKQYHKLIRASKLLRTTLLFVFKRFWIYQVDFIQGFPYNKSTAKRL